MKREVEKELKLPAFSLDLGELELLWSRMVEVFSGESNIRHSISISIPNETLEFDSISELKSYGTLRGRVTNFSINMGSGPRTISIRTRSLFNTFSFLKVTGETDLWCASAVEAVCTVINRNKTWYWRLVRLPFTFLFFILSILPYTFEKLLSRPVELSSPVVFAWFITVFALGFISFTHEKLLPNASIFITNDLGFVRRYGAEIGLALGAISFIASILMWLFPRAA